MRVRGAQASTGTNERCRPWHVVTALGATTALLMIGCTSHPTGTKDPEFPRGELLGVGVDGVALDGDLGPWSASLDGQTLVVLVPESTGCSLDVQLAGIDETTQTIDLVAHPDERNQEFCSGAMLLSPRELQVGADVSGFTVHVRTDSN